MNDQPDGDLNRLTDEIVESYHADRRTQRIGAAFLPSRVAIVEVLGELRQLLFPGYFGRLALTERNVRYHVGDLLARLEEDLAEQIFHCLCFTGPGDGAGGPGDADASEGPSADPAEPCRLRSAELARRFCQRIPDVRRMLALDAQAAYDGDPAAKSIDEVIYCYPGFYAITVHRIAHELHALGVPLMPRIMTEHAHGLTGTDIHPGARIGRSFFIDHATGVVIGETTRIGDNVKIYQGVTLGALSFPKDERGRVIKGLQRHPTIEDDVTIYANATILGGRTVIGKGAVIGGNTFITSAVEAGRVVGTRPHGPAAGPARLRADPAAESDAGGGPAGGG